MNTILLLFIAIIILFSVFLFCLLLSEKSDKKDNEVVETPPNKPYGWSLYYPTKCERCKKTDEFVTKPNMRFCNSCHCDYMMID